MKPRKVCYITGTRADFGLMRSTLQLIAGHEQMDLCIVATGMHLSPQHGHTVDEIAGGGLPAPIVVPVDLGPPSGALMARNIGTMIGGFVDVLERERPDIVLVLGDRGEMLAGAIAAVHLNMHVAHIHGGERSGTIDEPVRHAISKLSHIHLAASQESAERLERMGERAQDIHVVGAPGLDGLAELAQKDRSSLVDQFGLKADQPIALLVMHPVVQDADRGEDDAEMVVNALVEAGMQVVALRPNSDAGSDAIGRVLDRAAASNAIQVQTHLSRSDYVSLMRAADMLVGNSSSGIIEAATFGTPVVNLGTRQNLRQRNANVIDAPFEKHRVREAISKARAQVRTPGTNVFGDGRAGQRILDVLLLPLTSAQLMKSNAY